MSAEADIDAGMDELLEKLKAAIERHWGYREFRPLQEEAMRAMLGSRDSLVVLPTGGGKSLCYQAPAVVRGGTTVVVSPLISLMKDQVDSLVANGVPAAQLDSSLSPAERRAIEHQVREGALRLLFCSPERLVTPSFQLFLREAGVGCFAIDEAHCISHWGHDFRPEYRQLSRLKELFPGSSVHAFTATATERVRMDIIEQLGLEDPEVLVGDFDRPNLVYRVLPRQDEMGQIMEVLNRHKDEAGIIYCIRRKDVDAVTMDLTRRGYKAMAYHAGMTAEQRRKVQDAFRAEECDLIVATVAFGMGIDRSNIRFVLHIAMPKSIEAYQQETGRAGRDGLEAECVLLYSGQDAMVWKSIIEKSAEEAQQSGAEVDPDYVPAAMRHVDDMDRYARGAVCRHKALVEHFGQEYRKPEARSQGPEGKEEVATRQAGDGEPSEAGGATAGHGDAGCGACDLCLGDVEMVPGAVVIAQKILSCVARVEQRFGVTHVIGVLRGANTEQIRKWGHDKLSTHGLLAEFGERELRDFIYQLVGQKVLAQEGSEYPVLKLTPASWEVMKKQREVRLVQPVKKKAGAKKTRNEEISWEGVDQELFEALRGQRKHWALQQGVPPYVIFNDATLRELARLRPSSLERMRLVYGIGEAKLRDYGQRVLSLIVEHCKARGLEMDVKVGPAAVTRAEPVRRSARVNPQRQKAWELFEQGASLDEVSAQTGRARSTLSEYLCEWIRERRPASVGAWVSDRTYHKVVEMGRQVGSMRLKPIFVGLGESVPYEEIRIVVAHVEATR